MKKLLLIALLISVCSATPLSNYTYICGYPLGAMVWMPGLLACFHTCGDADDTQLSFYLQDYIFEHGVL